MNLLVISTDTWRFSSEVRSATGQNSLIKDRGDDDEEVFFTDWSEFKTQLEKIEKRKTTRVRDFEGANVAE